VPKSERMNRLSKEREAAIKEKIRNDDSVSQSSLEGQGTDSKLSQHQGMNIAAHRDASHDVRKK